MPNKRISELNEKITLRADSSFNEFPSSARLYESGVLNEDAYFMVAKEKFSNEKIKFKNLKGSILDTAIYLTGEQLISGHKTFSDPCTFLSRSSINEILDITQTGDISGNIFVGESGLLQNLGIGIPFFERNDNPDYTLDVSGDSCFIGNVTVTGDRRLEGTYLGIGDTFLSGDLSQTGNYYSLGNKYRVGDFQLDGNFYQTGDLYRKGDSNLLGDISQTGDSRLIGDTFRSGETNLIGDVNLTGNTVAIGDIYRSGDSLQVGDHTQTGDSVIYGDETVTGDIYLGEYLYRLEDEDTFLRFRDDSITLSATSDTQVMISESEEDTIEFLTSGEEQVRMNNQGFLAINNTTPSGQLAVTGKSFNENMFVWDEISKTWNKVYGGDDETVSFKTVLPSGALTQKINLPKTFIRKPILSVVLQHENGGPIIPLNISNTTTYDFDVNFGSELKDNHYYIHTTALAPSIVTGVSGIYYDNPPYVTCSDTAQNRHGVQRFFTKITGSSDEVQIDFPFGYQDAPVVTLTLEGTNKMIPYTISSVNKDSYTIIFGASINEDFTIHTFSSFEGTKRLG